MERLQDLSIREYLSSGDCTLAKGVVFVPGALRGALYDINTGSVYSVNQAACQRLTEEIKDSDFWNKLESAGLASKEQTEKQSILHELLQKPELQFVWFELISDDCNESCIHCYADSMPPTHRKALGIPTEGFVPVEDLTVAKERKIKLTANDWKVLIKDAHSLGCRTCQFIGGEPFLYKGEGGENVLDMAEYAISLGYEFIEIFTNATMLTPDKVTRIRSLNINIAVSLYSNNPEIHDKITTCSRRLNKD